MESYSSQHGVPVHSCDGNATGVLGGANDEVYLWDRRTRKTIKRFPDTHFMDVVQVRWCGEDAFISASEDGNVAVFDLSEVICEEDSFVGAVSINSMRRMGLFGRENERLWCCSNTETLHWWGWRAACDEGAANGTGATEANTREAMGVEYIIKCHQDERDGSIYCFGGDSGGQVVMFACHDDAADGKLHFGTSPTSALVGGHQGVVRDILVMPGGGGVLTGAEDGLVCYWVAGGGVGDGGGRGGSGGKARRYSPY